MKTGTEEASFFCPFFYVRMPQKKRSPNYFIQGTVLRFIIAIRRRWGFQLP